MSTDGRDEAGAARPGRRAEAREQRRRAALGVALEIAGAEGHDALTMPRLAAELRCGVASLYRIFASKDALVAELLIEALQVLQASWLRGIADVADEAVQLGLAEADVALATAVGAAWFWVVGEDRHPSQMELARRLFVDQRIVVPTEQAVHVLPSALALLNEGRRTIDEAVEAGALEPGNGVERGIVLIASVTGVVQTGKFGRWDQALFDARHLAQVAVRDSFRAWGAAPGALDRAFALVLDLAAAGRVAPAVA
jgi:AcrR family transcriptional regulator